LWLSDTNSVHTRRWVTALSEQGYEIVVFGFADPKSDWSAGLPNVHLESGGFSSEFGGRSEAGLEKLLYVKSVNAVRKLANQYRPKVVHAHYASSYGLIATLARLRPLLVSVWGADVFSTPDKSLVHRKVIQKVLAGADSVLSTSWTMRSRALELVKREIDVIPFGIDVDRFCPVAASRDGFKGFTIGSIKALEPKYGMEYLIRGFAEFRKLRPGIATRLVVVGSGSLMQSLQELSDAIGVSNDTTFCGSIDYEDVHLYHQMLDVAVYPSTEDSESFGVSVIESQACEVPVIVSSVGGLAEVVKEGETGFVVAPFDFEGIATALDKLWSNEELRANMGKAGRSRVLNEYSLPEAVRLLESTYKTYGAA
jgi:glycosyltransferase involved in cell wall biosynthesis